MRLVMVVQMAMHMRMRVCACYSCWMPRGRRRRLCLTPSVGRGAVVKASKARRSSRSCDRARSGSDLQREMSGQKAGGSMPLHNSGQASEPKSRNVRTPSASKSSCISSSVAPLTSGAAGNPTCFCRALRICTSQLYCIRWCTRVLFRSAIRYVYSAIPSSV